MAAPIDRAIFYARLRGSGLLGQAISQTEVNGIEGLIDAWSEQGWPFDLRHVAYTMATAWHEARLDGTIREWGRGRGREYGRPAGPYGLIYYGRSFSQLTWYDNYVKFGRLLGIDLARNPDLALEPRTGAAILIIGSRDGLFRAGKTLKRYFNEAADDPVRARDIINGDIAKNGALIAGHHRVFLSCLKAALLPAGSSIPVGKVDVHDLPPIPVLTPPPSPAAVAIDGIHPDPAPPPPAPDKGIFARMAERFRAAFPQRG